MLLDILTGHTFEVGAYAEIVFLVLCLAAAWMTGRSNATEWKSLGNLLLAVLLLGVAARFLHHALYQASFLSIPAYIADTAIIGLVAWLSYQFTRTNQMTRQYYWLYEKASLLSWRAKA
jgi:hypothetical protein